MPLKLMLLEISDGAIEGTISSPFMHVYGCFSLVQLLRMDLNEFGDFLRTIGIEPMRLASGRSAASG